MLCRIKGRRSSVSKALFCKLRYLRLERCSSDGIEGKSQFSILSSSRLANVEGRIGKESNLIALIDIPNCLRWDSEA